MFKNVFIEECCNNLIYRSLLIGMYPVAVEVLYLRLNVARELNQMVLYGLIFTETTLMKAVLYAPSVLFFLASSSFSRFFLSYVIWNDSSSNKPTTKTCSLFWTFFF